jgi:hypothetical protein
LRHFARAQADDQFRLRPQCRLRDIGYLIRMGRFRRRKSAVRPRAPAATAPGLW